MMATEYPIRATLKKVFWADVRTDVAKVAPEFAQLVDAISPDNKFPLYKATYPYGQLIVQRGVCYYPTSTGELVAANNPKFERSIYQDLAYSEGRIPAGIVLKNSIEIAMPSINSLFTPGHIFALWSRLQKSPQFHPGKVFDITSGARSLFMLPNIGDEFHHKKLREKFKIHDKSPKDLYSQWKLFTDLTDDPGTKCNWQTELLFLSGSWLEKVFSNDKKWIYLSRYLYQLCWQKSAFARNKLFYDYAFSQMQQKRNLKPNPYVADTAKHLLTIALGAHPGFAPAIDNSAAPIDLLQKIFLDVYKLIKYPPTFMHPCRFSLDGLQRAVYYSLTFPTTLEFSPHCRKETNTLHDLQELAHLLNIYLEEIPKDYLNIDDTQFAYVAMNIKFDYYHHRKDREKFAQLTEEMPKSDPNLISCPKGYSNHTFPTTAPFVRGCVKISKK